MSQPVQEILEFHGTTYFGTSENRRKKQDEVRNAYLSLRPEEIELVVQSALDLLDVQKGDGEEMLRCLACFQPGSLGRFHQELVGRSVFSPPVIYHAADAQVAQLIKQLLGSGGNLNLQLSALAWVGNNEVQQAFREWKEKPPEWAASLFVPPYQYAKEAGWELGTDEKWRDLFCVTCRPLVNSEHTDASLGKVRVAVDHEKQCPWCGRQLIVLLDLSREALSLLGIEGEHLRIATCDVCACYGPVFTKVDLHGGAIWHEQNKRPDYLPDDLSDWDRLPVEPLVLSARPRHFLQSANWLLPGVSFSQIGGLPTWVQDAAYPRCPECSRTMFFVGQLNNEDYTEYGEGIYYMHLCRSCRVVATNYQQS